MGARRSLGGRAAQNGAFPFVVLRDSAEKASAAQASPQNQTGAFRNPPRVPIRGRIKNPLLGASCTVAFGQARKRPPPRCAWHPPGKRTRRKRRVRQMVSQRSVPGQPMTGVRRTQDSPQTYLDWCDQASQPGFLSDLRMGNITVSY